ncbi:hypothetical protein [Sphingomonas profundi]|uniref:hypothetical protein n=1 Tax=Alterirhizorhabdus profundi TaxID=2681549 RepID=UPI0012E947A5|nr:hypothetical protein [Sphingomonas profundi]
MHMILAAALAAAQPAAAGAAPGSAAANADSPDEIARDAARDLKESRFYNRPGASRADYEAAWQACRLIARGTRTPTGSYTTVYNPNLISPVAASAAGGFGALIGQAIVEGHMRRTNRRACLMVRGWRLVEVDDAESARLAALSDAERERYFAGIVGAADLPGKTVSLWHNDFAAPRLAPESDQ